MNKCKKAKPVKASRFDVKPDDAGKFGFELWSANGRLLAVSPPDEAYATRSGARRGIAAAMDAVESIARSNAAKDDAR